MNCKGRVWLRLRDVKYPPLLPTYFETLRNIIEAGHGYGLPKCLVVSSLTRLLRLNPTE